jgi:RHS repeat-associated protein
VRSDDFPLLRAARAASARASTALGEVDGLAGNEQLAAPTDGYLPKARRMGAGPEYSTSTEEMLAAERTGKACDPTNLWNTAWCSKMPTVTHVVKKVTETANITVAGKAASPHVTEYSYRDPVFEGRQREFRGFRHARARRLGDVNSPTDITDSTFLLGECVDETVGAWNNNNVDDCSIAERWRDNPREALKGLPVITEKRSETGVYLSTDLTGYRLRTLYTGLDGRLVRHAFEEKSEKLLYDTGPFVSSAANDTTFVAVTTERAYGGTVTTETTQVAAGRTPIVRSTKNLARIRGSSTVDAFGNKTHAIAEGCVSGEACAQADEVITAVTVPGRPEGDTGGWLWRTVESYVTGSLHPVPGGTELAKRQHQFIDYNAQGDPVATSAVLEGTVPLLRSHATTGAATAPTPSDASQDGTIAVSAQAYNNLGNLIQETGANGRCRELSYDGTYQQLPTLETIYTGGTCGVGALTTTALAYDRGLGLVTIVVDMQGGYTKIDYDQFGRLVELTKPHPKEPGQLSALPSVKIAYYLPPDLGTSAKHSIIYTQVQDSADHDQEGYLESYQYVDGMGRAFVTLSEADPTNGNDGGSYIASDIIDHDSKGAVRRKYLPFFTNASPLAFPFGTQPTVGYGRQRYDAFGRQLQTFDLDGTITLQSTYHALSTDLADASDLYPGPHQGTHASERKDGHGRTLVVSERLKEGGAILERQVLTQYLPSGEPEVITRHRVGASSDQDVVRWMRYDTLGRMVLNVEPNTSPDFTKDHHASADTLRAWRYAYNNAGDLLATSDARGCGINFHYDGAGRLLAEDYSPCDATHAAYTAPNLTTKDGFEVVYQYGDRPQDQPVGITPPEGYNLASPFNNARLIAVHDRAATTWTTFDGRGRAIRSDARVAKPDPIAAFADRYAPRWYTQQAKFDASDREIAATTGATRAELQGAAVADLANAFGSANTSAITTSYTARGAIKTVAGSYGTLVANITRDAEGKHKEIIYGDGAATRTAFSYDARRRLSSVQTYRGPPSSWPSDATSTASTYQLLLQDEDYTYDVVNNPTEIRDWRNPDEWPAGAKPVTRKIQYDSLNRATRVDYQYSDGGDVWKSPFDKENTEPDAERDPRRAKPSPHVSFDKRVLSQTWKYDWLGNTETTGDDANGFYDRSLGSIANGTSEAGPYQLKSASNKSTASPRDGELSAHYDVTGNLTALSVQRNGPCLPTGSKCSQRFQYEWDEVGRLVRAKRWDLSAAEYEPASTPAPTTTPAVDLEHRYDAGDQRILKIATDDKGKKSHTVYVSGSLELRRAAWKDGDYELSAKTEVAYLFANGVRLARLAHQAPEASSGGELHVFLLLGDHLGSTSVALDKETGELVERSTYEAYGSRESDYRPEKWEGFREDYGFTGKEDDVEVGLVYFGKRFLSTQLNRWVSADPHSVQRPLDEEAADLCLYAYVRGKALAHIDPLGLLEDDPDNRSSTATLQTLKSIPAPIYEAIKASPTMRPKDVEVGSRTGAIRNFRSHPGSTFLGTWGEALVAHNLRHQSGGIFGKLSSVVTIQPAAHALPAGLKSVLGARLPDLLVVQVGAETRFGPLTLRQEVEWHNTIGKETNGQVGTVEHGANVVTSVWEVTVSRNAKLIRERADRVAAWAKAMPSELEVKAVLALDRGAYFGLSETDRQYVRDTVVGAGGYISLFRDLTLTSTKNADATADAVARANAATH